MMAKRSNNERLTDDKALSNRLKRLTLLSRLHLVYERYAWIWAPALAAILLFAALSFFGAWERIGDPWRLLTLLVVIGLFIRSILQSRHVRFPTRIEAEKRLEAHSGLDHRPIATLRDDAAKLAGTDQSEAWASHQHRAKRILGKLTPTKRPSVLTPKDKLYLRFALPVSLLLGLMVGMGDSAERLRASLTPTWQSATNAQNASFDAWIDPQEYTGRPPIYFKDVNELSAPEGSTLVVRLSGVGTAPRPLLTHDGKRRRLDVVELGDESFEVRAIIDADANLRWRIGSKTQVYSVQITPDTPPEIRFDETPKADKRDRLVLSYSGEDDIGITELYLELTRTDNPELPAERINLPLPGTQVKTLSETDRALSLVKHKWAGRQVSGVLIAIDGSGQKSQSEAEVFGVPDKIFIKPLAKAVVEQRSLLMNATGDYLEEPEPRDRTWPKMQTNLPEMTIYRAPQEVRRAHDLMEAVLDLPSGLFEDATAYMGLRYVKQRFMQATSLDEISALDETLWDIAMRVEFGPLGDPKEDMMIAEQNLRDGIARRARQREMDTLFARYNDAVDRYIEYLSENAVEAQGGGEGGPPRNVDEIQRLLDAIEEATRQGDTAGARRALAQLAELLENMQITKSQGGGGGGDGEPSDGLSEDAEEGLEDLAENLGDQRRLQDETRREQQRQEQQGQQGQNGQNGQEPRRSPEELAQDQQALSENLDGIEERLRNGGIDMDAVPERRGGSEGDEEGSGSESETGQAGAGTQGEPDPDDPNGGLGGTFDPDSEQRGAAAGGDGEEYISADEALDRAREAMRLAEEALERGDLEGAQAYQDEAVDMMRAISRAVVSQGNSAQQNAQGNQQGEGADPFGREGDDGTATDDSELPQKSDRQRAKELIDELRDRAAEQEREQDERDYLDRLLDRF